MIWIKNLFRNFIYQINNNKYIINNYDPERVNFSLHNILSPKN